MYSFNKYYKDASGETRDCRWFAAFYIVTKLCMYLLLFFPMTGVFYNLGGCTRCCVHYSFLLWSHTDMNTVVT